MIDLWVGSQAPSHAVFWRDWTGRLIDFHTGYTFSLTASRMGSNATALTKSTGITGAVGDLTTDPPVPNVLIAWSGSDWAGKTPDMYVVQIKALLTAGSVPRYMEYTLNLHAVQS